MRGFIVLFSVFIVGLFSTNAYAAPEYNEDEIAKLRGFLIQESAERGVKNFEQLGLSSVNNINWATVPGLQFNSVTLNLERIIWQSKNLAGNLDLSDFVELMYINCINNSLNSINLKNSSGLLYADFYTNELYSIDVSSCLLLQYLRVGYNNISVIDLSNNNDLGYLCCTSNRLKWLEVTNKNQLGTLYCVGNSLHTLILENCESLETFSCDFNFLTELDLNNLPSLKTLSCTNNTLNEINFHNCTSLESVTCYQNEIKRLDFSFQKKLKTIKCDINQIASIKLEGCEALDTLICDYNLIDNLDISSAKTLSTLSCKYNNLTFLTLPYNTRSFTRYSYMPQNYVTIECDYNAIDLSDIYNIQDNISRFNWYKQNLWVSPLESNEGMFVFDPSFIGETVVCQVQNSILPNLTMQYDVIITGGLSNKNPEIPGLSVYASERMIHVMTHSPAKISVYSILGAIQVQKTVDAGHTGIPVERGVHIVVVDDKARFKLIVG